MLFKAEIFAIQILQAGLLQHPKRTQLQSTFFQKLVHSNDRMSQASGPHFNDAFNDNHQHAKLFSSLLVCSNYFVCDLNLHHLHRLPKNFKNLQPLHKYSEDTPPQAPMFPALQVSKLFTSQKALPDLRSLTQRRVWHWEVLEDEPDLSERDAKTLVK